MCCPCARNRQLWHVTVITTTKKSCCKPTLGVNDMWKAVLAGNPTRAWIRAVGLLSPRQPGAACWLNYNTHANTTRLCIVMQHIALLKPCIHEGRTLYPAGQRRQLCRGRLSRSVPPCVPYVQGSYGWWLTRTLQAHSCGQRCRGDLPGKPHRRVLRE
jgi:hypothetical protein